MSEQQTPQKVKLSSIVLTMIITPGEGEQQTNTTHQLLVNGKEVKASVAVLVEGGLSISALSGVNNTTVMRNLKQAADQLASGLNDQVLGLMLDRMAPPQEQPEGEAPPEPPAPSPEPPLAPSA